MFRFPSTFIRPQPFPAQREQDRKFPINGFAAGIVILLHPRADIALQVSFVQEHVLPVGNTAALHSEVKEVEALAQTAQAG